MKYLVCLITITLISSLCLGQSKMKKSRDLNLQINKDSSVYKVKESYIWQIDTIENQSAESSKNIIIIDGKRLPINEIKYPLWIKRGITLPSLEGNFRIKGREMKIENENYPLLDG